MNIYFKSLIFFIIVYFLHGYGLAGAYRADWPWFDGLTHFLGEIGIALLIAALLRSFLPRLYSRKIVILLTIGTGIVWELFETYYNVVGFPLWTNMYYVDTIKDLFVDVLAGLSAAFLFL